MKTKLDFEFNDNEDDARFYMICNAENLYWSLYDLKEEIHDMVHHDRAEELGLDPETLDHVAGMIHKIMSDHNVDFEHVS